LRVDPLSRLSLFLHWGKERKEKKELFLANPSAPHHQYWALRSARKQAEGLTCLPQAREDHEACSSARLRTQGSLPELAEVLAQPIGLMEYLKISLKIGKVVKLKNYLIFQEEVSIICKEREIDQTF